MTPDPHRWGWDNGLRAAFALRAGETHDKSAECTIGCEVVWENLPAQA